METRPCSILVCGLPGSGKSYFAAKLAAKLQNSVRLSSDELRSELNYRGKYSTPDKLEIYRLMRGRIREILTVHPYIIVEATFFLRKLREEFKATAEEAGALCLLVEVTARESTIRKRLEKERIDSEADFAVYQQVRDAYEPIDEPHLSLSSEQEVEKMISEAMNWIKEQCDGKK